MSPIVDKLSKRKAYALGCILGTALGFCIGLELVALGVI